MAPPEDAPPVAPETEVGELEVRELDDLAEMTEAERLLARVWGAGQSDVISVNIMKALAHTGNYVAAAFRQGSMVGASVAFAWGPDRPAAIHSHVTGIDPAHQGRGIGLALKRHQAGWARNHGLTEITWTYDPLIRRNAWFNLVKLGARAVSYHRDHYGVQTDGFGRGQPTDRCLIVWNVSGLPSSGAPIPGRPTRAVSGSGTTAETATLLAQGPDGRPLIPTPVGAFLQAPGRALLCHLPADIVAMRDRYPEQALSWLDALRRTMEVTMAHGYAAVDMTPEGAYVLERADR